MWPRSSARSSTASDISSDDSYTFSVQAADTTGNRASKSVSYQVVFSCSEFFQPIDNLLTLSSVKAG